MTLIWDVLLLLICEAGKVKLVEASEDNKNKQLKLIVGFYSD